jgi:hypothetical protein
MGETRITLRRDPLEEKGCPTCGKTFAGLRRAIYCSLNCRNRASYHRHLERRRTDRRARYAREKEQAG